MADLDDLGFTSLTEMNNDEALEQLRLIRLARRTPVKVTKAKAESIAKASPKTQATKATLSMDPQQAAELLKLLTGDK